MKEKLESLLKEANISEVAARQISEGISEAFDNWTKKQDEIRTLEDKETFALVKESLDKVKEVHQKELGESKKQLTEAKEDFQKRLNAAREGVKKLIEEDYNRHKQELAQKVKLFVESKWQEVEQVIREQVETEVRGDSETKRTNQLSEAITKFLHAEQKPVEKIVEDTKKIDELKGTVATLIKENTEIKTANKQLQEKLQVSNRPLIKKVNESKIGKVLEIKEGALKEEKEANPLMNEILYLANYNRRI